MCGDIKGVAEEREMRTRECSETRGVESKRKEGHGLDESDLCEDV